MATIADIANQFRQQQTTPLAGFNRGVQQGQQNTRQNQLLQLQQQAGQRDEARMQQEQSAAAQAAENKALGQRGFAAFTADDPQKWAAAQANGLIPPNVPFETRDQFVSQSLSQSLGPEKANKIINPTKPISVSQTVSQGGEPLSFEQQVERDRIKTATTERTKAQEQRFSTIRQKVADEAQAAADTEVAVRAQLAIPLETGPGETTIDTARRGLLGIARFMGQDEAFADTIQKVNDVASFKSIQESLTASRLRAEPGVKTDSDAARMRATLANLNNPSEANNFINNMILSDTIRKQQRADFFQEAEDAGETNMQTVSKSWREFVRQTPQMGVSPATGRPIFLHQFLEANPDASQDDIMDEWRSTYAPR